MIDPALATPSQVPMDTQDSLAAICKVRLILVYKRFSDKNIHMNSKQTLYLNYETGTVGNDSCYEYGSCYQGSEYSLETTRDDFPNPYALFAIRLRLQPSCHW